MVTARGVAVLVCVVALGASACSSGAAAPEEDPTTASPAVTASPTAPSPSPSDPFALPDPVTEEYVDRVVNTIYEEWGAITRELLEQPADPTAITPIETRERIEALFAGQRLQSRFDDADEFVRGNRAGLLPVAEYGQLRFETEVLTEAGDQCIVAVGRLDFAATATSGGRKLVALSLSPTPRDVSTNPTGWRIVDQLANIDGEGEELPERLMLEAEVEDFGSSLDHSC